MTDRAILHHPPVPPGRIVPYGPLPHQVYEVVGEPVGASGWVVLVHGGFWRAAWDRAHLRPLATALAAEGYAVALLEYARTGMEHGGWDGTFRDVAAALAATGLETGESPVVLVGHSAGGHLAAWLLHQPETRAVRGLRGAVCLAGCLDLTMVAELGLDDGAAQDLVGGTPRTHPARYDRADPARLGRSPYPVVVVHGSADEAVPPEVSRSWWERCATPGRDRLDVLDGVGHFALVDPASAAHPVLLAHVARLLAPH
ncbi:alpha/beta hydrolase family protein [Ornithinimicrobium cerasi]|uniref:alpha/beta hydrolase family protein n=1 Tax=Ornithinimicrobium cerasi TaxID=2248773 RepID=UPI00137A2C32|nr:alpha/beta hydrolase [Ornithinimicrobium cerasi]